MYIYAHTILVTPSIFNQLARPESIRVVTAHEGSMYIILNPRHIPHYPTLPYTTPPAMHAPVPPHYHIFTAPLYHPLSHSFTI